MTTPPAKTPLVAVYPGSFDPITRGHLDILERASSLFDQIIVAIGQHPKKRGYFSVAERVELIEASVAHLDNVTADSFEGLVVDFCKRREARMIVRGLRAMGDFESEFQMGLANRDLAPDIETVFLIPSPEQMFISSSLVREIAGHGGDFERHVPEPVAKAMHVKLQST